MQPSYYQPCKELNLCNELIEKFFQTKQYEKCFEGHMALAMQGYPLAECQIGYFYLEGLGVQKDLEKPSSGHAVLLIMVIAMDSATSHGSTKTRSAFNKIWNRLSFGIARQRYRGMI